MFSLTVGWTTTRRIVSVVRLTPFDDKTPDGRSKERYRRVALTSLAAVAASSISAMTSLISVPLTLHYLGAERYGLWMTISSVIALLGFADLGMGNGLLNAIAEANGKDDAEAARRYVSSGFFLLLGIAFLILIGFGGIYWYVPWPLLFNVHSDLAVKEAGPATAVLVCSFGLNMPLGVAQRVQMGYQEGFKNSLWSVGGALVGFSGVVLAVFVEAGLPWLVLAMAGGPLLAQGVNWIHVFAYSHPSLVPSLRAFDWSSSRKLAGAGLLFFVLQALALLGSVSDNMVIAQVLGASAVAGYAVTQKLFSITLVAQYFVGPLWPAFGEAMARKDYGWARRTLNRSLVVSLGLGLMTGVPLCLFGKQIIAVWVGRDLVPSTFLLLGFSLWVLVSSYSGSMSAFFNSGALLGKQTWLYGFASIAAVTLKIVLAPRWGVSGVIWATVLGYGLFYVAPAAILAYGTLSNVARVQSRN